MKITQYESGLSKKIIPIIVDDNGVPFLHVFVYLTLSKFKGLSYNTQYAYVNIIKELYLNFASKGIKLSEVLLQGDYDVFFKHFEALSGSFIFKQELSYQSQVIKLACIRDYISWSLARYISLNYSKEKSERIKKLNSIKVQDFFNSFTFKSVTNVKDFKSLESIQVDMLVEIVHPESSINPFKREFRLRNFLIIQFLLETGLRIGELLNLTTKDLKTFNNSCNVIIGEHSFSDLDIRKNKPQIKTKYSTRIIAISSQLEKLLDIYIKNGRRNFNKIKHPFLFTSSTSRPLSLPDIYKIFDRLNLTGQKQYENKWKRVSPHMLRHTFAYNFIKYLIEENGIDMERAKDELRKICGWKNDSTMPIHYVKRYISEVANTHNVTRLNQLYEKH
ncbi:MAG: site-specific integrase [Chitinophagaceae bacterium]|nr:site-specific integrase [Chitinophagaceae bacterium]